MTTPVGVDPADPFPEPQLRAGAATTALAEVWAGRRDPDEVKARFGFDDPAGAGVPPAPGPWIPRAELLVRITTDHDPAAGAACPDLVLGPAADLADRRSLQVAVAHGAFFVGDGVDQTPLKRWLRDRPPLAERDAVRAVARAPLAPWRIEDRPAVDRIVLSDVVGLWNPGLVHLRTPGLPLGPVGVGDLLLARIARGPDGPVATLPIGCPGPVPAAARRWIRWIAWHDQLGRTGRPPTRAGLLARHGHLLSRRILEAAWAAA